MPRPVDGYQLESKNVSSDVDTEDRRHRSSKFRKRRAPADLGTYYEDSNHANDDVNSQSDQSNVNCSFNSNDIENQESSSKPNASPKSSAKKKKMKFKDDDDDGSSEEERWLHAIESGKLEEVDDELKKIKPKDPKLMTARQRAMLERKSDKDGFTEQLLSLPTGYREKIITPEMLEEKAKKLQKRKQLADEKRENDKKKTMERLLKKSESKSVKVGQKMKGSKKSIPRIIYTSNNESTTIAMPADVPFVFNSSDRKFKPPVLCGRTDCDNVKRYTCSKTGIPLCSLSCYKMNMVLKLT